MKMQHLRRRMAAVAVLALAATTRPAAIQKPGGIPTCSPLVGPNTGLGHNSMIVMIEA